MIRILYTLVKLAVLLGIIAYASHHNTMVDISLGEYLISASSLTIIIVLVIFLAVFSVLVRGYGFLRGLPLQVKRAHQERRRNHGYQALTRGMVAVAAGEKLAANKAAFQAEKLLQDPPLTMLLSAQAAQLDGDELAAKKYFEAMLSQPEMAFLGMRGLIMQALNANDTPEAQMLLSQAEVKFPKQPWVTAQNLQLQERLGHTEKALALLTPARRLGSLSVHEAEQKLVYLTVQSIERFLEDKNYISARKSAEKIWKKMNTMQTNSADKITVLDLLFQIALKQERLKDADDYLAKRWDFGFSDQLLEYFEQRLAAENLEGIARWRQQKRFLEGRLDNLSTALYLSKAALAVEMIGEAEAVLRNCEDESDFAYCQQRVAIAVAKDDHHQAQIWQCKAVEITP